MSCRVCGSTENLQVHHISYEPEETEILCMEHHLEIHKTHGVGRGSAGFVEGTTIWITDETKAELDKLKIISEEPYHKVIARLIDGWKENQTVTVKKKEST